MKISRIKKNREKIRREARQTTIERNDRKAKKVKKNKKGNKNQMS